MLLLEGLDVRYGARHLKRSVERLLVSPLSNLVASEQVGFGDLIYVDLNAEAARFTFSRVPQGTFVYRATVSASERKSGDQSLGGIGMPVPQRQQAARAYAN
jgi:hypothetical protein